MCVREIMCGGICEAQTGGYGDGGKWGHIFLEMEDVGQCQQRSALEVVHS